LACTYVSSVDCSLVDVLSSPRSRSVWTARNKAMAGAFAKIRDGLKKEFSKLTGNGQEGTNDALVAKTEDATADSLVSTDWTLIGQLCDMINAGDVGCVACFDVLLLCSAAAVTFRVLPW
jgi:hypothetical protein